ncbi:tumor necrosis factor receptor superfamily member 9a [Salminus brasiliensis]|uniref:tumor necrosis factor receptor superfamily member 9a n=1 Tax=Salminus brasiliensis TaxID=930266 RepID=UPI003B82FA45
MLFILWSLCHLLLFGSLFEPSEGIYIGCSDWHASEHGKVCCVKCHPGNRLVKQCGTDPTQLCKPCEANTFTTNPTKKFCDVCTVCPDPQFVQKPCNATADTVCGCKGGTICGNQLCSFCVQECRKGQEPENRGCRECPEGTFNDKIHSFCRPWRASCPKGKVFVAKGDAFSDIKCSGIPKGPTVTLVPLLPEESNTVKTLPFITKTENTFWPIVGIVAGFSVTASVFILLLGLSYKRSKKQTKAQTKDPKPETLLPEELRVVMVQQDDACSFRQPEQEQGGSLESIDSQDSETKLLA